jgi:RNA polymerase sigma factor (sigma-70 family)
MANPTFVITPETRNDVYNDFFTEWESKVKSMVHSYGIPDADIEDVYQDLILWFWEKDYLALYDPTKSTIATYFYGILRYQLLSHRRKHLGRVFKMQEAEALDWEGITSELDTRVEGQEILAHVKEQLAGLRVKGKRNLARLFSDLEYQVIVTGEKNQADLARHYNVTRCAVTLQMRDLRQVLQERELVVQDAGGYYDWA